MKWRGRKLWVIATLLGSVLIGAPAFFLWNLSRVHQHCIKNSGSLLRGFAIDHGGKFPVHTNGFGDALALLVAESTYYPDAARYFVGVGDDGAWLRAAATNGSNVSEDRCTRIYVQGLDESKYQLAILFDRYAVRGGDHFRSIFQPYVREVCMADGSMQVIRQENWAAFASNQVELLVGEGISRATAEAYYRPTLDPKAIR